MNEQLRQWIAGHWTNLLKYCVYNNPDGWRQFINDHSDIPGDQPMTEDQMINFIYGAAIRQQNPTDYIKRIAGQIKHNDDNQGWANVKKS